MVDRFFSFFPPRAKSSVFERTTIKLGDRGRDRRPFYRYSLRKNFYILSTDILLPLPDVVIVDDAIIICPDSDSTFGKRIACARSKDKKGVCA